MGYHKQRVLLYKQDGETFSQDAIDISSAYRLQMDVGRADKKDVFKFSIVNANNKFTSGENTFDIGDNVKIYIWENASTYTDNDLLFDGIISEVPAKVSSKGRILTVKGNSRLEIVFNALIFLSKTTLTLPEVVADILKEINSSNNLASGSAKQINFVYYDQTSGQYVDQDGTLKTSGDETIARYNSKGEEHSVVQVREIYKRGIELVKKYSSGDYTLDGLYLYYLDQNNNFYWKPKTTTVVSSTITNSELNTYEVKYSTDDIITGIVVNVGVSPARKGNTVPVINPTGVTKHGARWKYVTKLQNLSETIMQIEETQNASSFDLNENRFPNAYPYTTFFRSSATFPASALLNQPAATAGSSIVVANDKQYDACIRREAEYIGQKYGEQLLALHAEGKLRVEATKSFDNTFDTADLINHTLEEYNLVDKPLRLVYKMHDIFKTKLTTEEDESSTGEEQ